MTAPSLRRRTIAMTVITVLCLWAATGAMLYSYYRTSLFDRLDEALRADAAVVQQGVRFEHPQRPPRPPRRGEEMLPGNDGGMTMADVDRWLQDTSRRQRGLELTPTGELPGLCRVVRVGRDGVVVESEALQGVALDIAPGDKPRDVVLPDGRRVRVLASQHVVRTNDPRDPFENEADIVVTVGRYTHDVDVALAVLVRLLIATGLLGAVLIFFAVRVSVAAGLAPVEEAEHQLAAIGEHNLSARVDAARVPVEIDGLVAHVNGLLSRMEEAFVRERSFIASAAHELRTPLAALHTSTEVALNQSRDEAAYRAILQRNMTVIAGMHDLVEKLLLMARLDHQQASVESTPIHVRELAATLWEEACVAIGRDPAGLDNRVSDDFVVQADPDLTCIVLANLLRNAAQYGGSQVRVEATGQTVTVGNDGCELDDEQVAAMFDRFWQKDPSRSRTGENAGLGLSIARRAAELMNAQLGAQCAADWLWMTVAFAA